MGKLMVGFARILPLCALLLLFPTMMLPGIAFAQRLTATITPTQGSPGTTVTGTGTIGANNAGVFIGKPGDRVQVKWDDPPFPILANTTVLSNGTFSVSFNIPSNATAGAHDIIFNDLDFGTSYVLGSPTFTIGQSSLPSPPPPTSQPTPPAPPPLPPPPPSQPPSTSQPTPTPPPTAPQGTGGLVIDHVWTQDGNGNDKTTFIPGDAMRFTTIIRNTYNRPVEMWIGFFVDGPVLIGNPGNPERREIHASIQRKVTVLVGQSAYFSPWTIPASTQPGSYSVGIQICWGEMSVTTGRKCSGTSTVNEGSFIISGSLATTITTLFSDGTTPSSALVNGAGAGEPLLYKITVTNTGLPAVTNTGVILNDPLPREIFAIIGTPRTDHGTCSTMGAWPLTTLACLLGRLAFGETATISFTASINVRNPDGTPSPPKKFVNTVSVWSDQQTRATSASVKTLVIPSELTDAEALAFLDAVAGCVALVPGVGSVAGLVWEMLGRDLATGQQSPYIEKLKQAVATDSEELLDETIKEGAEDVGLSDKIFSTAKDSAKCVIGFRSFLTH